MKLRSLVCSVALGLVSTASPATSFVIVNGDGPGVGLNDPTPVAPVGMNSATTLGEQRRAVIEAAADYWAERIESIVPIHLVVTSQEGTCTPEFAFFVNGLPVGSFSGPLGLGSPIRETVTIAQHNARQGFDERPANATFEDFDIHLVFNPLIDTGCTGYDGWSYDTDPTALPPANRAPLLSELRLEIARGLGQYVFGDPATGVRAYGENTSDRMDFRLFDVSFSFSGMFWSSMASAERAASARNYPSLVWEGPDVTAAAAGWLDPRPVLQVHGSAGAVFEFVKGPTLGPLPAKLGTLGGRVVPMLDGTAPETDGCETPVNAAELAGNIALVDRGGCTFPVKAMAAQGAGAIAVLIANNIPGDLLTPMGGTDPALVIPALGITQAAGAHLRGQAGARVTAGYDLAAGAETTEGMVRMRADRDPPNERTIAEFIPTHLPRALRQTRLSFGFTQVHDGLSFALLRDIGWQPAPSAPNAAPYIHLPSPFMAVANQPSTLTEVWFGDIDAGNQPLTLVFDVSAGVIELEPDVAVQSLGSGTSSAEITGSRLALQTYLGRGGVRFRSPPGHGADVDLVVTIDDNGNSGAGGARTATGTGTISMTANAAPAASGQTLSTPPGTPRVVDLSGTDAEGDGLAFAPVSAPLHGTLTGQLGHLTYTPDEGFIGTDQFDFIALDGVLASAPATVSIVVVAGGGAAVFADGFEAVAGGRSR